MAVFSPEELKGKLFELSTVDIRSVVRWLNNNTFNHMLVTPASLISTMQHGEAMKRLCGTAPFTSITPTHEQLEAGYLAITDRAPEAGDITMEEIFADAKEPVPMYKPKPAPTDKAALLAQLLAGNDGLDENKVRAIANEYTNGLESRVAIRFKGIDDAVYRVKQDVLDKMLESLAKFKKEFASPTNLTITFPDDKPPIELGVVHKDTPRLIKYLAAGCHVFLTGPAGSGKSTGAELAAKALELPFYAVSVCSQTTETKLLGYMDAAGNYHGTQFRDAFEKGGVFLMDEIDAGNANVIASLNSALSNSWCAFPDKMVKRHEKFRCIAAGNTWGTGRTIQYVGRNALDAATLNRFVMMLWEYDENLETTIANLPEWTKHVQACRAEIKRRGVNFLITPRASIMGANLLRAGVPIAEVVRDVLIPNLDPDIASQLPPAPVISV